MSIHKGIVIYIFPLDGLEISHMDYRIHIEDNMNK
jgi:hypothetical protein